MSAKQLQDGTVIKHCGDCPDRPTCAYPLRGDSERPADWCPLPDAPEAEAAVTEVERQAALINGLMFDAFGEPRRRYVRVTLASSHCILDPIEGDRYVQDARDAGDDDADNYVVADVHLSEREFDDLPEFDGF